MGFIRYGINGTVDTEATKQTTLGSAGVLGRPNNIMGINIDFPRLNGGFINGYSHIRCQIAIIKGTT